jgi:hypothetical protein
MSKTTVSRSNRQNKSAWDCLRGHVVRQHASMASDDADSPRVKVTLPRVSILEEIMPEREL